MLDKIKQEEGNLESLKRGNMEAKIGIKFV